MCNCRRMGKADSPAMRSHFAWFSVTSRKTLNNVVKLGDHKGSESWIWKFTIIETTVYWFSSKQNEECLFQNQSESMLWCTDDWFFHFRVSAPLLFCGVFYYPQIKIRCFFTQQIFWCGSSCLVLLPYSFWFKNSLLLNSAFQLGICGLLCHRTVFFTQSNLWVLKENGGLKSWIWGLNCVALFFPTFSELLGLPNWVPNYTFIPLCSSESCIETKILHYRMDRLKFM